MTLDDAVHLISEASLTPLENQHWLDLGCGSGLFTQALGSILPKGSLVTGIDLTAQKLPLHLTNNNKLDFLQADFTKDTLPFHHVNGLLMANALHYVKNKRALLLRLQSHIKISGIFIIIEYDTWHANAWVPYPIPFAELKELFLDIGYSQVEKIGERNSVYNTTKIYACCICI